MTSEIDLSILEKQMLAVASTKAMVKLYVTSRMTEGCLLCTDSGARKCYVIGYLDSGEVFVERAKL